MRPLSVVFLCVLSLALGANAQAQSPDFQSSVHIFPQFVDGTSGDDHSYISTLQVTATDFYSATSCNLALISMPAITLSDARGFRQTSTSFNFVLAAAGWQILQSQRAQSLHTGSAIVQCDRPVTAHLIYTLNVGDTVSSETTVLAAPPAKSVQLLADQRRNARLGLAIVNPFWTPAQYRISVYDINGQVVKVAFVQLLSGQTFTRFLDEFAALPRDFRGPIIVDSITGTDIYAAGLKFTSDSFTAIPASVRVR